MSFGKRIKEYIDYKRISVRKFEVTSNLTNGAVHRVIRYDSTLNGESIENIGMNWEDLNMNWLMKGVGEMILKPSNFDDPTHVYNKERKVENELYWLEDALKRADEQIALQKDMIDTLKKIIEAQKIEARKAGIEL